MDLQTISFLFGAILVAVAILGGGFEVKEIKVPQVRGAARAVAAAAGLLFLLIGSKDVLSDLLRLPTPSTLIETSTTQPPSTSNNARMPAESETWFVQFGVFKDRPNAEIELRRLQNNGVDGLRIVGAAQFPGLQDQTASYLVVGPMSQSAASALIRGYTLEEPRPFVRNAFTPPRER